MALIDQLRTLSERAANNLGPLETEEATKNALVMPFIAALGYDVFNPHEVVPEFTADIGIKKGEKVDYAIKRGDEIIMLFEVKKVGTDLGQVHASQLYRYFHATSARIGVLTNGHTYRFYSDLEAPNKMDGKAFMEVSLLDLNDPIVLGELQKLTKESFDLDNMLSAASELKNLREIRRVIERQLTEPEEDFVKFFFQAANPTGRFMPSVKEPFTRMVRQAFQQVISERVSQRLRSALEREDPESEHPPAGTAPDGTATAETNGDPDIVTTEEELEGFRTVRAIVCNVLPVDRITHRDAKTYFAILADDNNRKPICRLHLNRSKKYLGLLDESKNETRHPIERIEDIYKFADELRASARRYVGPERGDAGEKEAASA